MKTRKRKIKKSNSNIFLEKAIEGGLIIKSRYYRSIDKIVAIRHHFEYKNVFICEDEHGFKHRVHLESILLDIDAWRAVGRVSGWYDIHDRGCESTLDYCTHTRTGCGCEECDCNTRENHRHKMLEFIGEIADGNSIEEALKNI